MNEALFFLFSKFFKVLDLTQSIEFVIILFFCKENFFNTYTKFM